MAHEHDSNTISYKTYFITWVWLLVLTAVALGLGYAPINESLKALLLVCTTLAKILVIAAIFMHLRFDRWTVWLLPGLTLALAAFFVLMLFPDLVWHQALRF